MSAPFEDEYFDIIGKARAGRGLSVREAARLSGLDEESVSRMESGGGDLDMERLARLAPVLGLSAAKLERFAAAPAPPRATEPRGAVFSPLPRFGFCANGYALGCAMKRECVLVDPADDPAGIGGLLSGLGLKPLAVILTHGHSDHTQGLEEIAANLNIPALAPAGDRPLFGGARVRYLEPGEELQVGKLRLQFLDVPGHTPGGGTIIAPAARVAFTGDVLFARSVGRPSVTGPAYSRYLDRIREAILGLPGDSLLCPGHGPLTSVRDELSFNPFFP